MNKSIAFHLKLVLVSLLAINFLSASNYGPFFKALAFESAKVTFNSLDKVNSQWAEEYAKSDSILPEKAAKNFKEECPGVMFGLSNADYQIGGHIGEETSFHRWAKHMDQKIPGTALNFWNNYKEIIDDVASTGAQIYRLSISWERLQPNGPDEWNEEAMNRYVDIVKYIKEKGMEPLVVFHHYTIPTWFEDIGGTYLGGFTKEKNNKYFVDFATRMYKALAPYAQYYSTCNLGYEFKAYRENQLAPGISYYAALYAKNNSINEERLRKIFEAVIPNIRSLSTVDLLVAIFRYITTQKLPSLSEADTIYVQEVYNGIRSLISKKALQVTHQVKANILKAHVDIHTNIHAHYNTHLKNAYPTIAEPKVGIQTTIHPLYPEKKYNPFVAAIGSWQLNRGFYEFFVNDIYHLVMPRITLLDKKTGAHKALDWIGINAYDRSIVSSPSKKPTKEPGRQTATDKADTPEVIATAVQEVYQKLVKPLAQKTGKAIPIIITENGIAPKNQSNAQRNKFYSRAIHTVKTLVKQGYPIIAYTPWSSHDNFEWGKPFGSSRYGMFRVEGFGTENPTRTLKDPENNFYVRFCREYSKQD